MLISLTTTLFTENLDILPIGHGRKRYDLFLFLALIRDQAGEGILVLDEVEIFVDSGESVSLRLLPSFLRLRQKTRFQKLSCFKLRTHQRMNKQNLQRWRRSVFFAFVCV